jgi:hypothetical protein
MASTYEELFSEAPAIARAGTTFAFGRRLRRRESVARAFASIFRVHHREQHERPALPRTLVKLLAWIVASIATTSAGAVVLAVVVVRIWSGIFD